MRHELRKLLGLAVAAGAMAAAPGCGRPGLEVLRPPLPVLRNVPALAVVEPARLTRHEFTLAPEANAYRPSAAPAKLPWLS